ncbi:response regulator, partial [Fulvivirga sp. RKSG066]|uniref:ATP-binding protein n=1 Tax=Fulvivirga aurantia TaxID=2529383 RepID=UPI0012BD1AA2
GILLFIYSNIIYFISKNTFAKYFAFAGLAMVLSISYNYANSMLTSYGVIDEPFIDSGMTLVYGFEFACLLQVIILALALSYRGRVIERERSALKALDQTKARFFSNISHEFKTPLTLILGPAKELLKEAKDEKSKALLQNIKQNGQRLLKLINEILELSKIESGQTHVNLKQKDLVVFLKNLAHQFQSYAASRDLDLFFTSKISSVFMAFDPDLLEKVVINLLSNACKFTEPGGQVNLDLVILNEEQVVEILVKDTGRGISSEKIPRLFDRFYHGQNEGFTTDQSSTGIGLALTKELVTLHEGTIAIDSRVGVGTTVTIKLPLRSVAISSEDVEVPTQTLIIDEGVSEKANVLIIEDNDELRSFIVSCLGDTYHCTEACNGVEGVEKAVKLVPDLIISDVMMPLKDGYQVCDELKSHASTDHIPIVILTGKSSQRSRLEGLQVAADVYLSKPFDPDELRLVLANLVSTREKMRLRYTQILKLETTEISVDSQEERFMKRAIESVESNIADEDFGVEELSQELNLDRTQLFRKLKTLVNMSPSNFIRELRLKRAKQMLEAQAATVSEVAFAVGFRSTSYFIKCYKDKYNHSPGSYKTVS